MPFATAQFKYDCVEIIAYLMKQVTRCSIADLHLSLPLPLPCTRAKCVYARRAGEQNNGQELEHEKG